MLLMHHDSRHRRLSGEAMNPHTELRLCPQCGCLHPTRIDAEGRCIAMCSQLAPGEEVHVVGRDAARKAIAEAIMQRARN